MSARPRAGLRAVLAATALALALPATTAGQAPQVHGESSSFAGHGVAIVWGILRGASETDTQVVLRVAQRGDALAAVSMDGVDPFTQNRRTLLGPAPLGRSLDVRTPRESFGDLPRRELHFYTATDRDRQRPSLTVYFLGVPDTTPEFATEAALRTYLEETLAKLGAR